MKRDVTPPLFTNGIQIQAWEDTNITTIRGPDDMPFSITMILPSVGNQGDVLTIQSIEGSMADGSMEYDLAWMSPHQSVVSNLGFINGILSVKAGGTGYNELLEKCIIMGNRDRGSGMYCLEDSSNIRITTTGDTNPHKPPSNIAFDLQPDINVYSIDLNVGNGQYLKLKPESTSTTSIIYILPTSIPSIGQVLYVKNIQLINGVNVITYGYKSI